LALFSKFEYIEISFSYSTDILTALKGDGSFKANHGFVVYRLHLHDFIASCYPPCFVR